MHFCNKCENMLYIRLLEEDSNDLVYYCRNCGETDQLINKDNICVLKTDILSQERAYVNDINKYTKQDPTLPRTNMIRCPNQQCPSNSAADSEREVIYIRYDDKNVKYIYLCSFCDKTWKTNEQ